MTGPAIGTSRSVDLGAELHYVEYGGATDRPTVVLVHGLGGSHLNWDLLAPRLAPRARVFAIDLPGFGLSAPTRRPATIASNVRVLAEFVRYVGGQPAMLVGNSMGGLVSILLTSQLPALVSGLVLLDPALPAPSRITQSPATAGRLAAYALPWIGEDLRRARRRRIGARGAVNETLRLCGVDQTALPAALIDRSVALVERQSDVAGIDRAYLSASRSLAWALIRARRYHAAMSSISVPVLLIHGKRDQIVPITAARAAARRHPGWHYIELPGAGHLPQLQQPDAVAADILHWLAEADRPRDLGHRPDAS